MAGKKYYASEHTECIDCSKLVCITTTINALHAWSAEKLTGLEDFAKAISRCGDMRGLLILGLKTEKDTDLFVV